MHHEQYPKFQSNYKSDVIALVAAFEQLGNPFLEDSGKLLDLDQSIFMPLIWSCLRLICLNQADNPGYLSSKTNMQKVPRFCWQPILVASSMTMYSPTKVPPFLPRLLVRGAFTMEARVRSWTALSLQILTIRDQWRQLLCWMVLFSFKCFVLEVLWPSKTMSQMCLCHISSLGLKEIIRSTSSGMFTPRRIWSQELGNKEAVEHEGGFTLSTKIPSNWSAFLRVDLNKQEFFVELAKLKRT